MPIPATVSDLSQTPASNYPTGGEVIGSNLDNYLRAHAAFIRQAQALAGASIASAATINISASDGESVLITGTTTITSLGSGFIGCKRELRFDDALTISASSSILLPSSADITTAAGDVYTFRCTASGVWTLVGARTVASGDSSNTPVTVNTNTTLGGSHVNQVVEKTSGSSVTWTFPPSFGASGDAVLCVNNSDANLVIARGSGVSIYRYGSNGDVTIPPRRSVLFVKTTTTDVWQS